MLLMKNHGLVLSPCSSILIVGTDIVPPFFKKGESEVLLSLARFMNNLKKKKKGGERKV